MLQGFPTWRMTGKPEAIGWWSALNSVKATIWHRNSGFSIEARGDRAKEDK
jgi:hypothetical protein